MQYQLDGEWEYPGDPGACVFASESDADAAGESLRERCPEYRDCAVRVVAPDGSVVTTWDRDEVSE